MAQRMLQVGEPSPWFVCRSPASPRYDFSSVAGRYVVLCFFGTASNKASSQVLSDVLANRQAFDDENYCFFGVSNDPDDEATGRIRNMLPGVRFLWDFDRAISCAFGAAPTECSETGPANYQRFSIVLDERLRVLTTIPFPDNPNQHIPQLLKYLRSLPSFEFDCPTAPVLVVPRIFSADFCRALVEYYEAHGGEDTGFMREEKGMTVHVIDHDRKQRRDQTLHDQSLRGLALHRIRDCLVPEIAKAFQFHPTRIERYIVACYDSATGGHFHAHRDNTTKGTAHRKFAVSLNLNSDFEGGNLRFPEFGKRTYKPPAGGAVVFSCSLLHEATPITKGKRYAFLPFLYDDAAAKLRQENAKFVIRPDHRAAEV